MTKSEASKILISYTDAATNYFLEDNAYNLGQSNCVQLQEAKERFWSEQHRILDILMKVEVD